MTYFILIFIASYIIGIIGWSIIITVSKCADTYDELRKELCDSPAFIPIVNIICLIVLVIGAIIISLIQLIYQDFGIKEWWNEIKCKKLPFRE